MSKVTDALRKAEQERKVFSDAATVGRPGFFGTIRQELREELGWSPPLSKHPGVPQTTAAPLEPAVAPTTLAHSNEIKPAESPAAASPEAWDRAMALVKRQLEGSEQHAARQAAEHLRLKAQLAASEQLIAQMAGERASLQQRLDEAGKAAAAIEAEKVAWLKQFETLRQCEELSHTVRMAERAWQANNALTERIAQSQQQVSEELAHYRQRGQKLQQQVQELRFRLAQALAVTGTVETGRVERQGGA